MAPRLSGSMPRLSNKRLFSVISLVWVSFWPSTTAIVSQVIDMPTVIVGQVVKILTIITSQISLLPTGIFDRKVSNALI